MDHPSFVLSVELVLDSVVLLLLAVFSTVSLNSPPLYSVSTQYGRSGDWLQLNL